MDTYGKCIDGGEVPDSRFVLDLSDCPDGMYFLELRTTNGLKSIHKIIKSR